MENSQPQMAVVQWVDSLLRNSELELRDILKQGRPAKGGSVGWLLRNDELGVTLALTSFQYEENAPTYRQITTIPRCAVESVVCLAAHSDRC